MIDYKQMTDTETILGYAISNVSVQAITERIFSELDSTRSRTKLMCANPHSLVTARGDTQFQKALRTSELLVPDGAGIVLASKILGGTIRQRVTGSDVFWNISQVNQVKFSGAFKYFFLGSNENTLNLIMARLERDFPAITVAGWFSPPYKETFSDQDSERMIEEVNVANPDILWIGMTAPKQEKWLEQNWRDLNVGFAAAIGAVFDFYAGTVRRSHPLFQKIGLEWLPRLAREPRRLFRRNFVSSPIFMRMILSEWLRQRR